MVYANIELLNGDDVVLFRRNYIKECEIRKEYFSLKVDKKQVLPSINQEIVKALGLEIIDHRPSQLADGSRMTLPVAGSILVRYEGRFCTTNAFVLPDGNEPLLGAIPMEEMDLWVNPARKILTAIHPEGPVMSLKSTR